MSFALFYYDMCCFIY